MKSTILAMMLLISAFVTQLAFAASGMQYPAVLSFNMKDYKGVTYITFLKQKLKPSIDLLSDKRYGGGAGFQNVGSTFYSANAAHLDPRTLAKYKGAKWDRRTNSYGNPISDVEVERVFDMLKRVQPVSTVQSLNYYDRNDEDWALKNDIVIAMKEAGVREGSSFDIGTLYALTGGMGAKVKLDENNFNYHVLYKPGKTDPHQEVMSGRSFSSSSGRGAADATDPEYLKDLSKYLKATSDQKPFYRNLILAIANSDTSELGRLSAPGQALLSDFFTVYTAEAIRHLMVNLKDGVHPWEIDLAAVTAVSALSAHTGVVVQGGQLVSADLGAWFAPSPNNVVGGPQRSGIGITRRDRIKLTAAIHKYELTTHDGKEIIAKIQQIIGTNHNQKDVIQGVFEFLSNPYTPESLGTKAGTLADLFAKLMEISRRDAQQIFKLL